MTKVGKYLKRLTTTAVVVSASLFIPSIAMADGDKSTLEQGKELSFEVKKGNCLACHIIAGGDMAGNIGPPLIAMKARFPDKAVLRAQIWDATVKNPATSMPPFGRHEALSEKEIDLITDYIYTL